MISVFAAAASVALASAELLLDEGVSLLQLRVEKHTAGQAPTLRPLGSECDESEILTYRECLEVLMDGIGGNAMMNAGINPPNLQANPGQLGCFYVPANRQIYYNPGPESRPHGGFQPICSPNGGRQQEKVDFPVEPLPEVEVKQVGELCDEGCGRLTLDQCIKVGVDNLVANGNIQGIPIVQLNDGGYGCYLSAGNQHIYYNVESPGSQLIERANKGSVANVARHICGVCTTTTTEEPPEESPSPPVKGNEAAAVGDPHITNTAGQHFDFTLP